MKKILLITAALLLLQGCTLITHKGNTEKDANKPEVTVNSQGQNNHDYLYYYVTHSVNTADNQEQAVMQTESNGFGQRYSFNGEKSLLLSEVVSKMADQLLYNFPKQYHNQPIALTSIVDLNDHSVTNWLGQTVSEQFFHELHIRHLRVIDFKLTGNIQLVETGEFALTRDWKKLNKNLDVQRILTGTMSRNEEGVIFNIRIVNAKSNLVESTSSAFVPHNMFVGGEYNAQSKKYLARDSRFINKSSAQVQLVR
ncbi:hypothetical protein GCM10007916_03670 [Psychromonas marina]|uniref:FlgO domain-containing protein n=1 Tax=Psychromonas marina TaxID=88364 RepID=A0ABQ6DWD4_9GAMM|nr:FlgO family outer membrane protein [Psychromonas marina]GLS89300.1 hypothetical protein GCM10007916_03670 [Psychromonas marina]